MLALGAGAAGIEVAVLLLRNTPGPAPTQATTSSSSSSSSSSAAPSIPGGRIATPNDPRFPSPPPGALVLSREAGSNDLGVAVVPYKGKTLVRASVVDGNADGVPHLDVRLALGGAAVRAPACGAGCYQSTFANSTARRLTVSLGKRSYVFALPSHTSDATGIVSQAGKTWLGLKTLVWHERLGSSPTEVLYTLYKVVAPDELSYAIQNGSGAIIIGTKRWDRGSAHGRWIESPQEPPLSQPRPFWYGVTDANVIGTGRARGHAVWDVTFFDPVTPAWFTAEIEQPTHRTLVLEMIAAAHFMHHVYGPFDAPIKIEPPAS